MNKFSSNYFLNNCKELLPDYFKTLAKSNCPHQLLTLNKKAILNFLKAYISEKENSLNRKRINCQFISRYLKNYFDNFGSAGREVYLQRKGLKNFLLYISQKELLTKNQSNELRKVLESHSVEAPFSEPCRCGSGKIFVECCFRSDHRVFNLRGYLEELKDIKISINNYVYRRFLQEYETNREIRDFSDKVSRQLKMMTVQAYINQFKQGIEFRETDKDRATSAVHFETSCVDYTPKSIEKPLFKEALMFYLRKASQKEKEYIDSFASSQFSLYEVIDVRRADFSSHNTWVLLREVFTHKEYELKDPQITAQLSVWDMVFTRLYHIDGFNLLSTAALILSPEMQKAFNRILLVLWIKDVLKEGPHGIESLRDKYPSLFTAFPNKYASIHRYFYHRSEIRRFLKRNAPLLFQAKGIMRDLPSHITSPKFKAPDDHELNYVECHGMLNPQKKHHFITKLRTRSERFIETSEQGHPGGFKFDYVIPRKKVSSSRTFDSALTPDDLIQCGIKELTHNIFRFLQKSLQFQVKPLTIDLNPKPRINIDDYLKERPQVKVGFIEIKDSEIFLTTYSEESMKNLRNYLREECAEEVQELYPSTVHDLQDAREDPNSEASTPEPPPKAVSRFTDGRKSSDLSGDEIFPLSEDGSSEGEFFPMNSVRYKERWCNRTLPILEGKTPKEAVDDPDLFLLLIDMVKEMENHNNKTFEYNPNKGCSALLNLDLKNETKK